jgi:hypothetical protein
MLYYKAIEQEGYHSRYLAHSYANLLGGYHTATKHIGGPAAQRPGGAQLRLELSTDKNPSRHKKTDDQHHDGTRCYYC